MKKHSYLMSIFLCLCSFMMLAPNIARAENPSTMLNSVADRMIAQLKSHKTNLKSNPSLVYSLAYKIIVPHADLNAMSMRVLPPQTWSAASPGQREEFKKEFTTVLVRTYASALADYTDETVNFHPIRGGYEGKSTVTVDSEIVRSDGPSISVNYRLLRSGANWRLYDMTVEGISMLESFRSQFGDELAQGNMTSLIKALKRHNVENSGE